MTGHDLRSRFLEFWQSKNSLIVPSSSLIPTDPTTLLTSAGMQPLVPYFKGEETPPSTRLASCQKCCRADDIEQVGVTWRHASFFEMLGNFSFGDYFKREAIVWAWEFLVKDLGIDPDVLWVSVYEDDEEAPRIWRRDVGLSDERIYRFGKKDNWWGPVGRSGPCGPDSEIFYDRGAKYDTGDPELDRPGGDGDRYGEIWNLVFQQYNQTESGELLPLPAPGIDTGMGLERVAAILQGVDTIHQTDLFAPIVNAIFAARTDVSGALPFDLSTPELNPENPTTRPARIIADHVRAAIFLCADGVTPGQNGRDYMLRRFIRRALLNGRNLGIEKPFLYRLIPTVVQSYGDVYPELRERESIISGLIEKEEERFENTIEAGIGRLEDLVSSLKSRGQTQLAGEEVFRLYETYGFPRELTQDIAAQEGIEVDDESYRLAAERHSATSGSAVGVYQDVWQGPKTEFVGYNQLECDAVVVQVLHPDRGAYNHPGGFAYIDKGNKIRALREYDGQTYLYLRLIFDRSPFYAESGGQVGDTGVIYGRGRGKKDSYSEEEDMTFRAVVVDTQEESNTYIHLCRVEEGRGMDGFSLEGVFKPGLQVHAVVDAARRRAIERAHSATHLLHAALREHLGAHVQQRGSLVEADRLRFDFVHFEPMAPEEIGLVENTVNEEILRSTEVVVAEKTLAEAKAMGAMALFGEKYGDVVRTVKMGDFSLELCGGTHLPTTSAAGVFRIVSETGVSANVRRIEALTGLRALDYDRAQAQTLREVADELNARPENIVPAAEKLKARVRELERELAAAQRKLGGGATDEILASAVEVNGIKVAASRAPEGLNAQALRELADALADKLDGVVILAAENEGKVMWAVKASKGAVAAGAHAGNIVKKLAQITGGGGGGRPDFAQAGGKDASKIDEALRAAPSFVGA